MRNADKNKATPPTMNNSILLKATMWPYPLRQITDAWRYCAINITMSTREWINYIPDFEQIDILHDMHNNAAHYVSGIIYQNSKYWNRSGGENAIECHPHVIFTRLQKYQLHQSHSRYFPRIGRVFSSGCNIIKFSVQGKHVCEQDSGVDRHRSRQRQRAWIAWDFN